MREFIDKAWCVSRCSFSNYVALINIVVKKEKAETRQASRLRNSTRLQFVKAIAMRLLIFESYLIECRTQPFHIDAHFCGDGQLIK